MPLQKGKLPPGHASRQLGLKPAENRFVRNMAWGYHDGHAYVHLKESSGVEAKKYHFPRSPKSSSPPESGHQGRHLKPGFPVCVGWGWAPVTFALLGWHCQHQFPSHSGYTAVPGLSCHTAVTRGYSSMSSGRDIGYKATLPLQGNYPNHAEHFFHYSI